MLEIPSYFPWTFLLVYISVLGSIIAAYIFILRGTNNELIRLFILTAAIDSHAFLACFSYRYLHEVALVPRRFLRARFILCFDLLAIPASAWVLLFPDMTSYLLAQTIISISSRIPWLALSLFKLEVEERWKRYRALLVEFINNLFRSYSTPLEVPQDKDVNTSLSCLESPAQLWFTYWEEDYGEKDCEKS